MDIIIGIAFALWPYIEAGIGFLWLCFCVGYVYTTIRDWNKLPYL